MFALSSLGHRFTARSTLTLLLAFVACSDDDPLTAPVVPVPTTASELAGTWSLADSSVITTPAEQTVCQNRGVVTFTAGVIETRGDVRIVGLCVSPRGRSIQTSQMEGDQVAVVGDSIAFTVSTTFGIIETCNYAGRLTGGSSLGASGSVTCSRGRTGTWQLSWGLARPAVMGKLAMVDVAGGYTCALDVSGRVFCWGANGGGQLGTGDLLPRLVPASMNGDLRFTQISVADNGAFTCGLTSAGQAYCWGNSFNGQLGDGSGPGEGTAVLDPKPVVGGHSFKQIVAAGGHTCALTTNGAAYCWGRNSLGQLGTGNDTPSSSPIPVSGDLTFRQIDAYTSNTCGVTTAGSAWCWGEGWSGILGNGDDSDSDVPVPVSGGHTFTSVSVGLWMACGVTTAGDGYCWGMGAEGLGTGTGTLESQAPVPVTGGLKWKSIRAGGFVACGVTVTNVGYCWGQNVFGVLGIGITRENFNRPMPISGGLSFDHVMADFHACGLTVDGVAYCWGDGSAGEVGDGYLRFRWEPVKVAGQP